MSWQLPESFDEFRVLQPLGQGAMGRVFLARDTLLDRLVAVKLIAGAAPDEEQRRRFRIEAQAVARVQHPAVVEIYRAGEVEGRPYLVSEYVRGRSLDQVPGPLPWERALEIAAGLAGGLAAAHRGGVLHRDIKPANVMLTGEGAVKLLDFGVAKLAGVAGGGSTPRPRADPGRPEETVDAQPLRSASPQEAHQPTGLIGTPRYMAPEVWRGEPATAASDLYSLGVLLYELCSGGVPHAPGDSGPLRDAVLGRDAEPLLARAPGTNPAFAAIVDRCLARDPARRFASAEDLLQALEPLRADGPVDRRLSRAAAEWERLERPGEQLWRGRVLREASALDPGALGPEEAAFLRASRRAASLRRSLFVAALVAAPVAAASGYGWLSARAANALAEADRAAAHAGEQGRRGEELRRAAYRQFDADQTDEGARTWAAAMETGAGEAAAYEEAIRALDRGLEVGVGGPRLRRRLAELLSRSIPVAERDRRPSLGALLQRLAAVDPAGEYRGRLDAPGHLRIETEPPGAAARIDRAVKRGWEEVPGTAGTTPILDASLPPGSYRLRFEGPGRPPVLYPVLVARGEHLDLRVPLPASVPDGYAYVAPGRFLYGAADDDLVLRTHVRAIHPVDLPEGYLIGRHEVTMGEWIGFLRALPPEQRARRRPHGENYFGAVQLDERAGGKWELAFSHGDHTYRALEGTPFVYLQRGRRAQQDWLRFPVSGISWDDAREYLAWLDRTGKLPGARLCTELEWERAARGADGREYPHGDQLEPDDANFDLTYGQQSLAFGPDEVGSHPASDSPFGVSDMAGNVWEWVASSPRHRAAYAGGGFYQDRGTSRSLNHGDGEPDFRWPFIGLRACARAPAP